MRSDEIGFQIPTLLIGKATPVRRRLRSFFRRAIKAGLLYELINDLDYVDIDDAPGWIQIHGPMNLLQGDNVVVWLAIEELWDAEPISDNSAAYQKLKQVFLNGLDYFWFALCMHSSDIGPLPFAPERDAERPLIARQALSKFLCWWDKFCDLEHRYSWGLQEAVTWPMWGAMVLKPL